MIYTSCSGISCFTTSTELTVQDLGRVCTNSIPTYERLHTRCPHNHLLMHVCGTTSCATSSNRITGEGILPLKQALIDVQAEVLQTHCPLFEYEGRGFLVTGTAPTQYSFMDLLHLKGSANLQQIVLPVSCQCSQTPGSYPFSQACQSMFHHCLV